MSISTAPIAIHSVSSVSSAEFVRAPSNLMRAARIFYFVGLAALLLLFSPVAWIPTSFLKLGVFGVCLAVSIICFSAAGGMADYVRSRTWQWAAVLVLPAVYVLSWWFSTDRAAGILGTGNEVDSVLFITLGFATFFMGSALLRGHSSARNFLKIIGGAALLAALFQFFEMAIGVHAFPSIFSDATFNTIGKWNDFGIFVALAAVLAMGRMELFVNSRGRQLALWASLIVSALLLAVVDFNVAWGVVLGGALLVSLFQFFARKSSRDAASSISCRWGAVSLGLVAALFMVWGGIFNAHLPGALSIPSLEVRPALSSTYQIAQQAHTSVGRMLLGAGPNTFGDAWLMHKPTGVNETQFWAIDFGTGFSTVATAYESVGALGILAWLLPLVLMLAGLWRLLRSGDFSPEKKLSALLGILGALLWAVLFFYAVGQVMVLLAFAMAGAFAATRTTSPAMGEAKLPVRAMSAGFAVVLVVLGIFLAGSLARRSISVAYAEEAALALGQGNYASASAFVNRSESVERTGDNARLGVAIDTAALQALISATSTTKSQAELQQQFQNLVADAINNQGEMAIALEPKNYQSYTALAGVYDILVPLKVQGAYQKSQEMYQKAMALDPSNPTLPLLLARTEVTANPNGNLADIATLIDTSIALKSNYTDALLFNEQLAVAKNDLPGATKAALAAAESSPSDPSLWFQLGLYYYAAKDWQHAGAALAQAVALEPDYANAKYFLGLAYYNVGDPKNALTQFLDIQKTNPTNANIQSIIANLEAGKEPFAGQSKAIASPLKAAHAPLKE